MKFFLNVVTNRESGEIKSVRVTDDESPAVRFRIESTRTIAEAELEEARAKSMALPRSKGMVDFEEKISLAFAAVVSAGLTDAQREALRRVTPDLVIRER